MTWCGVTLRSTSYTPLTWLLYVSHNLRPGRHILTLKITYASGVMLCHRLLYPASIITLFSFWGIRLGCEVTSSIDLYIIITDKLCRIHWRSVMWHDMTLLLYTSSPCSHSDISIFITYRGLSCSIASAKEVLSIFVRGDHNSTGGGDFH